MKLVCITDIYSIDGVADKLIDVGSLTYFSPSSAEALHIQLVHLGYEAIFTNPNMQKFVIDESVLRDTNVKVIATASTGTNHIDLEYCKKAGIHVISLAKNYDVINNITSTAEHTMALMLALIKKIPAANNAAKVRWDWRPFVGRQLNQMTLGIVGMGRLGKMVFDYSLPLFKDVVCYDTQHSKGGAYVSSLSELLEISDVISLHIHLDDSTRYMFDEKTLHTMKHGSFLINTSHGDIVKEDDVVWALKRNRIAGYATDVVSDELGNISNSPIINYQDELNIIVTPHIAGMTKEARELAYNAVANELLEWVNDRDNR